MPASRLQRAWILLRLPLPALLLVGVPGLGDRFARLLLDLVDYGHSAAKGLVGVWVTLLYRVGLVPAVLVFGVVGAVVLTRLRGHAWWIGAALFVSIALLAPSGAWRPVLAPALVVYLANLRTPEAPGWRPVAWIPLTELVFPVPILRLFGVPAAVAAALGGAWMAGAWFLVDAGVTAPLHADEVWAWPADRVDPRVRVLARAAPGINSEFHGVEVAGDRVTVVAESSLRLLGFPRSLDVPAVQPLHPWWGLEKGLTIDSASDPSTGVTWYLDGPDRVSAVRWVGNRALKVGSSLALTRPLDHAYTRWISERSQLMLVTVNVVEEPRPPCVTWIDTPALDRVTVHELRTADGEPLPHLRDVEWIGSIGRIVLAPDFGTRLYLADPDTGLAEAWLPVATMNGRMTWDAATDRLYMAMPNRFEVLVVDPHRGVVERTIPTQPGVRPLAVDADRGLLVTASLATGGVWVQELDTGAVVDRFHTIMPMVREIALLKEQGIAVLTTWTQVYAVPYAPRTP